MKFLHPRFCKANPRPNSFLGCVYLSVFPQFSQILICDQTCRSKHAMQPFLVLSTHPLTCDPIDDMLMYVRGRLWRIVWCTAIECASERVLRHSEQCCHGLQTAVPMCYPACLSQADVIVYRVAFFRSVCCDYYLDCDSAFVDCRRYRHQYTYACGY